MTAASEIARMFDNSACFLHDYQHLPITQKGASPRHHLPFRRSTPRCKITHSLTYPFHQLEGTNAVGTQALVPGFEGVLVHHHDHIELALG